jgi:hypothetical protein
MSDTDLGDDIVQDEVPKHVEIVLPTRRYFKAWHRVRKQFIRERQWNHEILHLAKRLRGELQMQEREWGAGPPADVSEAEDVLPESVRVERPLRLFVLPGDDLIDVRSMWQQLESEGCYILFLGFNSTLSSEERRQKMAVTESAVTQLAKVCKASHVTGDRFQDIASDKTHAYRLFKQYGPYDVVNLDLCDSLVPRGKPGEMQDNYTALHQLLLYQIQRQRTPWILFATTQVDPTTANQTEINQLAGPTRSNCDNHAEFAAALGARVSEDAFRSDQHAFDISCLDAGKLVEVFGVLLGKWLMKLLNEAKPRCTIKLLSSYRYAIRADMGVEMLSLGFLITPHYAPPIDETGISQLHPQAPAIPTEPEIALQFVDVASRIRDVDAILADDAELRNRLAKAKADLLAVAGFDPDEYLQWVANGEPEAA